MSQLVSDEFIYSIESVLITEKHLFKKVSGESDS